MTKFQTEENPHIQQSLVSCCLKWQVTCLLCHQVLPSMAFTKLPPYTGKQFGTSGYCLHTLHYNYKCSKVNPCLQSLTLEKSRIRDTINFYTCADSSTNTKTDKTDRKGRQKYEQNVLCPLSCVTCHLSHVKCPVSLSRVTCHLSLVTNANIHSHKPSPC